ncbi:MAG TPA: tetratricopeptide repeat protein, partial [Verrucomicrobiae bacterium]|nr:tetratricopeptide repeat protein [Verrucomicrobiae bacterium]
IANTLLLFFVLEKMTGATWRSAVVAALFAWHPVHVESVAWISERKDVLSAFFWLLTMLLYARYVAEAKIGGARKRFFYSMTLLCLVLGLMSKPMVVTLPCVLLLMDFWPLARASASPPRWADWKPLLVEKLPMFGLVAASCVVTFIAQKQAGAVSTLSLAPLHLRIFNAFVSYVRYIGKIIFPTHLAILYPLQIMPTWIWVGSAALLLALCVTAITAMRNKPWFFTGLFWFLGTLVPVIGLIQVGKQALADRYTYLPSIGIFIIIAWGGGELLARAPRLRPMLIGVGTAVLLLLLAITETQLGYWQNSVTLFTHALEVAPVNAMALDNLGLGLEAQGQPLAALEQYKRALELEPNSAPVLGSLGFNLASRGDYQGAIETYQKALRIHDSPDTRYNLGNALAALGRFPEAAAEYSKALSMEPDSPDAENNLGAILLRLGKPDEAAKHFESALQLQPDYPEAHDELAGIFQKKGLLGLARAHYAEAVRLKPDFAHAQFKLGLIMAEQGDVLPAIPHFQKVIALQSTNADAYFDLGAAYAALESWGPAVNAFQTAANLRPGNTEFQKRLAEAKTRAAGIPAPKTSAQNVQLPKAPDAK